MRVPSATALVALVALFTAVQVSPVAAESDGRRDGGASALALSPPMSGEGPPLHAAMRLRLLDDALRAVERADRERVFYGWLQVGVAGVAGASLIWVEEPQPRAVLGLTSALALGRGIAQLAFQARAAEHRKRFAALADAQDGWQTKLQVGEAGLRHAARMARRTRLTDSSLTMIAAVLQVPLVWGLSRHDDPGYRFGENVFDYVGLSVAVIAFATGLVHTLVKSDLEKLEEEYELLPD